MKFNWKEIRYLLAWFILSSLITVIIGVIYLVAPILFLAIIIPVLIVWSINTIDKHGTNYD